MLLPRPQQLRSLIFLSSFKTLALLREPTPATTTTTRTSERAGSSSGIPCIPSCCHLQGKSKKKRKRTRRELEDRRQKTTVMISYLANCWPDNDSVSVSLSVAMRGVLFAFHMINGQQWLHSAPATGVGQLLDIFYTYKWGKGAQLLLLIDGFVDCEPGTMANLFDLNAGFKADMRLTSMRNRQSKQRSHTPTHTHHMQVVPLAKHTAAAPFMLGPAPACNHISKYERS